MTPTWNSVGTAPIVELHTLGGGGGGGYVQKVSTSSPCLPVHLTLRVEVLQALQDLAENRRNNGLVKYAIDTAKTPLVFEDVKSRPCMEKRKKKEVTFWNHGFSSSIEHMQKTWTQKERIIPYKCPDGFVCGKSVAEESLLLQDGFKLPALKKPTGYEDQPCVHTIVVATLTTAQQFHHQPQFFAHHKRRVVIDNIRVPTMVHGLDLFLHVHTFNKEM